MDRFSVEAEQATLLAQLRAENADLRALLAASEARAAGLERTCAELQQEIRRLRWNHRPGLRPPAEQPTDPLEGRVWCDDCTGYTARVVRIIEHGDELLTCDGCGRTWAHP